MAEGGVIGEDDDRFHLWVFGCFIHSRYDVAQGWIWLTEEGEGIVRWLLGHRSAEIEDGDHGLFGWFGGGLRACVRKTQAN
jgi:hypothetical protein